MIARIPASALDSTARPIGSPRLGDRFDRTLHDRQRRAVFGRFGKRLLMPGALAEHAVQLQRHETGDHCENYN